MSLSMVSIVARPSSHMIYIQSKSGFFAPLYARENRQKNPIRKKTRIGQ